MEKIHTAIRAGGGGPAVILRGFRSSTNGLGEPTVCADIYPLSRLPRLYGRNAALYLAQRLSDGIVLTILPTVTSTRETTRGAFFPFRPRVARSDTRGARGFTTGLKKNVRLQFAHRDANRARVKEILGYIEKLN